MKQFLLSNWYKLMIGSSLLMGSFGLMMYSITPVFANESKAPIYKGIPINPDGTISIRLTDEQLKFLAPPEIQKVDLEKIRGVNAAAVAKKENELYRVNALAVGTLGDIK